MAPSDVANVPYSHDPLRTRTSVRLLRCADHGPVYGLYFQICEFDLDNAAAPPYSCLSYTWGNPLDCEADPKKLDEWSNQHQIYLCGEDTNNWWSFSVTTNLYEFLCEFSKGEATDSPWIWIDAICINQFDLKERTVQVGLMRKIYLHCVKVIIWFGREGEDIQFISNLLNIAGGISQATHSRLHKSLNADYSTSNLIRLSDDLIGHGFPEADDNVYTSLTTFLHRSWFHRIWTMQESVLPPRGQVWCGRFRFTDMDTFSTIGLIANVYLNLKLSRDQKYTWPIVKVLDYLLNFLFSGSRDDGLLVFLRGRVTVDALSCLYYSRGKECSIPHDHIYATLGLQNIQLAEVDYEISVKEVYARVALHPYIRRFAFENASIGTYENVQGHHRTENLPSWVPDWSSPLNPRPWAHRHGRGFYRAGGSAETNSAATRLSENVIRVAGFQEDEVAVLGGQGWRQKSSRMLLLSFRILEEECQKQNSSFNHENMMERFWRTLVIDREETGPNRPSTEEYGPAFRNYVLDRLSLYLSVCDEGDDAWKEVQTTLESLLKRDPLGEQFLPAWAQIVAKAKNRDNSIEGVDIQNVYAQNVAANFQSRRFFITAKGRMGIGINITGVGDAIVIVKECEYPLVMRKQDEGCWKLVGQAYVENIMLGEALERKNFGDIDIE